MVAGAGQPGSTEARLADESMSAFEDAVAAEDAARRRAHLAAARAAAGDSALAGAYSFLQKLVGAIAVLLPLVVAVGGQMLDGGGLRSSISAYYYAGTGNVFVGALCALGVFFLSYQHKPLPGYELDNRLGYGASAAAIGVAVFPTAQLEPEAGSGEWFVSTIHMTCAGILFLLLAFFSLRLFTKSDPDVPPSDAKRKRNVVFRTCGSTIVAVIGLVALDKLVDTPDSWHTLFFLESVGVVAFGISWLVKSGIFGLLTDRDPTPADPAARAPAEPLAS
jgi:hypothetical protein